MGKIFSSIFGGSGSKSKQQSTSASTSASLNQAYPFISQTYAPQAQQGTGAMDMLANLLGYGSNPQAGVDAFNQYKDSAGYDSTLQAGSQAITGNNASKGLLNSGATLKSLDKFGETTNQSFYNNFLSQLLGAGNQGLAAGQLISGAGNTANSQSNSQSTGSSSSYQKPGIGSFLGQIASSIPVPA